MARAALKRILLVEDDPDIQTVAELALSAIGGFTVEVCGSAKDALERAPGFLPDLVLLDVMMPGMDGPSALKALRQLPETSKTPVVFMTARARPHEVAYYKQLGSLDVITKPFEPADLAASLRRIWDRHEE